jgi:phage pi2 protein 07
VIEIQVDQNQIEALLLQEIEKKIRQVEDQKVFWSIEDLCKQTTMSKNNIREKFFYDPRFPKYKVGGRWLMPAKECEQFLLQWIKEQPRQ